jgi:hypothetical protein
VCSQWQSSLARGDIAKRRLKGNRPAGCVAGKTCWTLRRNVYSSCCDQLRHKQADTD